VVAGQKPIEMILARNLLSSLSTPAFLVDDYGLIVFYNEAAGSLLGRRFEEAGTMAAESWGREFGPFDSDGRPIPFEELPVVGTLRDGRPVHTRFKIRSADGTDHDIEVSALPILTGSGTRGAIVVFWPLEGGTA
jgi:PAS domain-containing protein